MSGYTEIKSEQDIELFMEIFGGFHDSCVVSASYNSGNYVDGRGAMGMGDLPEHRLSLIMHSQWAKPVELLFTGVRKFSIVGWEDNHFCNLYDGYLGFHTELMGKCRDDRLIVWADCDFNPAKYAETEILPRFGQHTSYIVAETLCWRFIGE